MIDDYISKQISNKKYEYYIINIVSYNMYRLIHAIEFNKLYRMAVVYIIVWTIIVPI